MAVTAEYFDRSHENNRKRRKFTTYWDIPPPESQGCAETSSERSRKSSWDVPPLFFQCNFAFPEGTHQNPQNPSSKRENLQSTNEVTFQRSSRDASPPLRADDKDGHYNFVTGDNLTPRYRILGKMGQGTFGQVVECWDRNLKDNVAIKIVRGLQKYKEEAMIEIDMIQKISKHQKSHSRNSYQVRSNTQI